MCRDNKQPFSPHDVPAPVPLFIYPNICTEHVLPLVLNSCAHKLIQAFTYAPYQPQSESLKACLSHYLLGQYQSSR